MAENGRNNLNESLLMLQARTMNAKQSGMNPHFKSKYATLEDCWEACRKNLNELGLVVTQHVVAGENGNVLRTQITHAASGEYHEAMVPIIGDADMQKFGSAVTYARRYGLVTLVGILTGEDDDGNVATATPKAKTPEALSPAQQKKIFALFADREVKPATMQATRDKIRNKAMSKTKAASLIDKLEKLPARSTDIEAEAAQAQADAENQAAKDEPPLDDIPF